MSTLWLLWLQKGLYFGKQNIKQLIARNVWRVEKISFVIEIN